MALAKRSTELTAVSLLLLLLLLSSAAPSSAPLDLDEFHGSIDEDTLADDEERDGDVERDADVE
jgi:hypothetical protein